MDTDAAAGAETVAGADAADKKEGAEIGIDRQTAPFYHAGSYIRHIFRRML